MYEHERNPRDRLARYVFAQNWPLVTNADHFIKAYITQGEINIMPLSDKERELWMNYQNAVAKPISEMTGEDLQKFIDDCESTIFEAKAKQSKALAEKAIRENERNKLTRDQLIGNPRYSPADSPSNLKSTASYEKGKKAKTKAPSIFGALDLEELASEMRKKKAKDEVENGKGTE